MPKAPRSGPLSEDELINEEIRAAMEQQEAMLRWSIDTAIQCCESPIERVLIAAVVAHGFGESGSGDIMVYGRARKGIPSPAFDGVHIYPQVSIDGYRLDFLAIYQFEDKAVQFTVIEVDGHDFHERTKLQASHDKRRDRHFTKKGWQVLRYTGSEVWRSPSECAREVVLTAQGLGEEA